MRIPKRPGKVTPQDAVAAATVAHKGFEIMVLIRPLTPYNASMITFSLQSGSNGNAVYVEANGTRILFDAGISGACAQRRMGEHGRDMRDVDALLISHDHTDHIRSAGIYQRRCRFDVRSHPSSVHRGYRTDSSSSGIPSSMCALCNIGVLGIAWRRS